MGLEDIDIKLLVVGEGEVGKTALVSKFIGDEIPESYLPTIGNIISHKEYILDNKRIRLNVWDCGGQKAFNDFNPSVYHDVDGAFLVFDLSKPEKTIKNLKKEHIEHLEYYAEEEEEGILFFVGNKEDLVLVNKNLEPVKNALTEDDLILATSAKSGENVNECFELLIYTVLRQTKRNEVAKEFIDLIGKTEEDLIEQVIDLANIDILLLKEKVKPKLPKIDTISAEPEEIEINIYHDVLKELNKIDFDRKGIFDKFYSILSELEETLKYLRKSTSKSVTRSIEDFGEQLIVIGDKIESDLNYLSYLEKEENTVIDRLSEIPEIIVVPDKPKIHVEKKEIKIETKPQKIISDQKIVKKEVQVREPPGKVVVEKNLYIQFENLFPEKKAILGGKETIEFLDWMNVYLGIREPVKEKKEIPQIKTTKMITKEKKDKLYSEIEKSQLIDVNSEEDLDIISEQIKTDLIVLSEEENLYLTYEEENSGKKSVWRGKETKGFLDWKKKRLSIKSKDEKDKLTSEIAKSQLLEVKSGEDFDLISEKIKSDLILITDEDKLHLIYEEENPGKKAVWRGKITKGFLEWKKNYS